MSATPNLVTSTYSEVCELMEFFAVEFQILCSNRGSCSSEANSNYARIHLK